MSEPPTKCPNCGGEHFFWCDFHNAWCCDDCGYEKKLMKCPKCNGEMKHVRLFKGWGTILVAEEDQCVCGYYCGQKVKR